MKTGVHSSTENLADAPQRSATTFCIQSAQEHCDRIESFSPAAEAICIKSEDDCRMVDFRWRAAEECRRLGEALYLTAEKHCCAAGFLSLSADAVWRMADSSREVAGSVRRVAESFCYKRDPFFRRAEAFERAAASFRDRAEAFSRKVDEYCHKAETFFDTTEAFLHAQVPGFRAADPLSHTEGCFSGVIQVRCPS